MRFRVNEVDGSRPLLRSLRVWRRWYVRGYRDQQEGQSGADDVAAEPVESQRAFRAGQADQAAGRQMSDAMEDKPPT